jgi:hypothetical protein
MIVEFSFIKAIDPAQYTHLISFTPPANKPGELCRIKLLGIEIASYLCKHNSWILNYDFIKLK